ncbi:multiprotein-bridging factor 1b-like [Camellia sinensis]|uniref:multiprotein-bridging factor 1b-like n=1 Tax=Camellia sinensis TaxID=4442 RepID=UPI001036DE6D|nr:multiprotein-bridging factor 1b-like [Camellia sinensis]
MSRFGHISQDWEPVVICKKASTTATRKDEKTVNVRSSRRCRANAASNKAASSSTTLNTRKLDNEPENLSCNRHIEDPKSPRA